MTELDVTDEQWARIETLRGELEAEHAGAYAHVGSTEVLEYLLDLADAVDDPARQATVSDATPIAQVVADGRATVEKGKRGTTGETAQSTRGFPREYLREQLNERNRKHTSPEDEDRMDLYTIAAEYDVAGRSEMTKDELVSAILDATEGLYEDPFAIVDVAYPPAETDEPADDTADETEPSKPVAGTAQSDNGEADDDGGTGQLNAMLSLLDTHDDKWSKADGDARYEVELPDGSVEPARTKDDVRALLFKNY